jgi:hypothetical protein
MGKVFSGWPSPDPFAVGTGQVLRAAAAQPLGEALDYARSIYGRRDLVCASFPQLGGGDTELTGWQATEDQTAYSAHPQAAWTIPVLPDCAEVTVEVDVVGEATLDGWIKVVGDGAAVEHHALTLGRKTLVVGVDTTADEQEIRLWLKADSAGKTITISSVTVYADVLTSPLAAGAGSDGFVGVDEDELGADEALSTDLVHGMLGDLGRLRDTVQTAYQWSAWRPASGVTEKEAMMDACAHVAVVPVWQGSGGHVVEVRIRAASDPVDDTHVLVGLGPRLAPPYTREVSITIPAAAATGWYSETIQLPTGQRAAAGMPSGWDSTFATVWPVGYSPNIGGLDVDLATTDAHLTTARVLSVSAWVR